MRYTILVLFLAVGCGAAHNNDSSSGDAEQPPPVAATPTPIHSMAINTAAELPACTVDNLQQLIYTMDTKQFQTCLDVGWKVIEIVGAAGAPGKDGIDNHIVTAIRCSDTISELSVLWSYTAVIWGSGDVAITGSISNTAAEASRTLLYTAKQTGSVLGYINIGKDVFGAASGGWWAFELDRTTLSLFLVYQDNDVTDGKREWHMLADKCTKSVF